MDLTPVDNGSQLLDEIVLSDDDRSTFCQDACTWVNHSPGP